MEMQQHVPIMQHREQLNRAAGAHRTYRTTYKEYNGRVIQALLQLQLCLLIPMGDVRIGEKRAHGEYTRHLRQYYCQLRKQ